MVWKSVAAGVHPIYTLAMTEDGRYAACGRSNQIDLYDLATRQFVAKIADFKEPEGGAHRALVHSLAFSPDGNRMASGSFREVKIWRKRRGKSVKRAADKNFAIQISKLSRGGKQIVCANKAGEMFAPHPTLGGKRL